MDSIGSRIKKERTIKDVTQSEMGKALNIAKSTISQYENNINVPDAEMLKKLSLYFGCSIDYLLATTDIREPVDEIIKKNTTETIALHRTDGYDDNLPEEAKREIENFKEFIRSKYKQK